MTLAEVRADCASNPVEPNRTQLYQLLVDQTGRPNFNARSIGRHLKRHVDRVVAGMVLQKRDGNSGAYWRVEAVGDQHVLPYNDTA